MIIMPVPKDVRDIKPKFIGPLTKRQFYAAVPSAIIAVLVFSTVGRALPRDFTIALIAILDAPIILCGIMDVYGMPIYIYLRDVMIAKIFAPSNRPYATQNTFEKYAEQHKITYEFFDGDLKTYQGKALKKKQKQNKKRFERYLKENPDQKPIA